MIEARGLSALGADARLEGFDLVVGHGLHALVGGTADGVSLALAVIAGRARPLHGTLRLHERARARRSGEDGKADPHAEATVARPRIAWLGRSPALPDPLSVERALALAARVRGGETTRAAGRAVLAELGIESLARRPVATLGRADARAVSLAIALAAGAHVLLLDEPLAELEPDVATRAVQALRERAHAGACVVVGTASEREAQRLGARVHRVRRGKVVRDDDSGPAGLAVFLATASDALALVGALAEEEAIAELASHGSSVRAAGPVAVDVAAAIGRAAVRAHVDLISLERDDRGELGAPP